ncbi:hypothetical protein LTR78_005331 [Recurvomyces mirabilis]|uniref:AB hydrolase-1 domain-containing protein n=1 Tax=Recurvomyces mirabilis TaxID=574656 RepID=A0AAE0WNK5_9PEZI|nr:hypothetical protein LTR78_005331 [Recurvomyces mirabilis]KAK5157883.1 hypothetical protein LTS14_003805 [Recurvomyces mirabilis]
MDLLQSVTRHIDLKDRRTLYIALTGPIVAYFALRTLSVLATARSRSNNNAGILASPRRAMGSLAKKQLDDLPYPPDALPGGRDVESPYGSIRVYEWGPEGGRRVLLVHALAPMAKLLVEQGYRVMLFDLFGRGYSDTPDPELYPQDVRLFTSQVLLVLSSSPLSWTGSETRVTLIGYSLGGGISAAFTSYLPHLVESLVLIAPSGLIRHHHISQSSRLLYGSLLPQSLVNYYVRKRLGGDPETKPATTNTTPLPAKAIEAEVPEHPALAADSSVPLFVDRPGISPAKAVAWQLDAHPGFLQAFISSIRYAPIRDEHERWSIIGLRQEAARSASAQDAKDESLKEGKVLILLGKQDQVIVAAEVEEDATVALGKENVECVTLHGGHDVPIINARGCVDAILGFLR